jgi:predicted transcriptional regulator
MPMSKAINNEIKRKISERYRNSGMSNFEIAKELGISPRSVRRYKNYNDPGQSGITNQILNEPEKPILDIQNQIDDNLQENDSEISQNIELKCPECGAPSSEWVTIDHALDVGYGLPEGHTEDEFTHMCSKCNTLIKES